MKRARFTNGKGYRMNFEYKTKRLILKVLEPSEQNAKKVLDFQKKNRDIFEHYEAMRPADFYTQEYQNRLLTCEYSLALQKKTIRFFVFEKENPNQLIGTICFYNIVHYIYDRCETGYRFDYDYWHQGYAHEAMTYGISLMFEELNLHRIEAYVMEDNTPSIRLLKNLHFEYEGTCRKSIRIQGNWEDHMLFACIR